MLDSPQIREFRTVSGIRRRRQPWCGAAALAAVSVWLASPAFLACAGESGGEPAGGIEAAAPAVVARVNGKELTTEDLESFARVSGAETGWSDPESLREALVTRELVFQTAQSEGFRVTADSIDAAVGEWFGSAAGEDPALRLHVEKFLTVQEFLRNRVQADTDISLLDLQRYYEAHFDEFKVDDQLRVLEILVQDRPRAEQIRSALKPGDFRGFREAARTHSIGLTAAKGGDLGLFQPGDLPQRFENLIFSLKVGQLSPVFQSEHGFHLFLVEERRPRHEQKFYEVKDEIFRRLVAEKERMGVEQVLSQLRASADVDLMPSASWNMENP